LTFASKFLFVLFLFLKNVCPANNCGRQFSFNNYGMGSLEKMNEFLERQISPIVVPETYATIACLGFYRNWRKNGECLFRMAWKGYDR